MPDLPISSEPKSKRMSITDLLADVSDETQKLFRPLNLQHDDRLEIKLTKDAKRFLVRVVAPWKEAILRDGKEIEPAKYWPGSQGARNFISRLPEKDESKRHPGYWLVPITDFSALLIVCLWSRSRIICKDDRLETILSYYTLSLADQTNRAKAKADYRVSGLVPEGPGGFFDHPINPLSDYQRTALFTCLGTEASALFMEQGTGKTPIAIRRICHECKAVCKNKNRLYRALIVCPKNVRENWRREFAKFSTVHGQVAVIKGGEHERIRQMMEVLVPQNPKCRFAVAIISYDSLVRSWHIISQFVPEWDLAILDESHRIKGNKTKRAQIAHRLRERCNARMILTGTPIVNRFPDLFSQLEFLGEGFSGFSDITAFRKYYGKFENRSGFDMLVGYQNLPLLHERLARLAFSISKKEALPYLPDKTYTINEVSLTPKQKEVYQDLLTKLESEIEGELNRTEQANVITANNILTRLLRLAQITSGFVKFDDVVNDFGVVLKPGRIEPFNPNPKLDALAKILATKKPDEKTIIWACFKQDIKAISERLTTLGIGHVTFDGSTSDKNRDAAVTRYNADPSVKVFIGNAAAGGTGINLWGYDPDNPDTCETNTTQVVYFSQNWSMGNRAQSEDRAHRRGMRVPVQFTDLVVLGSIDQEIRERVVEKRTDALALQDVRQILASLANHKLDNGD